MKNKPRNPDPAAELKSPDAVTLLKADHLRVKRLFAQFSALKEEGSDQEKSTTVAQICLELTIHTALEEEIFYPAVREAIDDNDQMDEAVVEHAGAKELIAQLTEAQPSDPLYDAKVTVLSEQIDHHVMEEEGSMFPKAVHAGLDLIELGERMEVRRSELQANPTLLDVRRSNGETQDDETGETKSPRPAVKSKKPSRKTAASSPKNATKRKR